MTPYDFSLAPRRSAVVRKLLWRVGRKMYTYARGEGQNNPRTNGEYWLLRNVLDASRGSQVLLDIGANKGNWTAQALSLSAAGPHDVRVHAFEPASGTRAMLASRFAGTPSVTVEACALSDAPGEANFYTSAAGAGTNSLAPLSGPNTEKTTVTTVDRFLAQSRIDNVSMVKIDTEGFDLLVLRGALGSLTAARIEVIQFEYNWRWLINNNCLRDVFELIAGTPYRLGKLVGEHIEFYERWHAELDRFFETNYVLVHSDSPICAFGSAAHFDISSVGCAASVNS